MTSTSRVGAGGRGNLPPTRRIPHRPPKWGPCTDCGNHPGTYYTADDLGRLHRRCPACWAADMAQVRLFYGR